MNKRYGLTAIFAIILMFLPLSQCSPALKVQASPKNIVIRLWGGDRYQTACAVSREGWQTAETVILTKGEGTDTFTDALASSVLSTVLDAPMLFYGTEEIDEVTMKEIERLKAKTIYILGGDDAIFASAKKQLEATSKAVIRISGRDRYETAVKIASEIKNRKPFSKIILTNGLQFQYAMMAAPYAARDVVPILFTENDTLSPIVKEFLKASLVRDVEIIGGQSVVSQNISGQLKDMGITATRVDGEGIQEINLKIIENYFPGKSGVAIARDDQYVDALVGVPLAAKKNMPVVLVGKDSVYPRAAALIKSMNTGTHYIFGGTGVISQEVVDTLFPDLNSSQLEQTGNTPGNTVNGGNTAELNGWVYFSNLNDGKRLYKSDLNDGHLTKLSDYKCRGINVSDDWIYYVNESRNSSLYKIKTDGTEEQEVFSDTSFFPCINGDWIYYVNYDDHKSVYRINKDGSSRIKLNDDESFYINVADNWIYYSNLSDNGRLYKMKTDGSSRTKVCDDKASFINVSRSVIYYSNQDDKNSIYKITTDGVTKSRICSDSAFFLNLSGDFIYYVNSNKNSTIYKVKKDGSEKGFLNYETSNSINIAGGWVYYYSEDYQEYYKIKHDGSSKDYVYYNFIQPLIIPQI